MVVSGAVSVAQLDPIATRLQWSVQRGQTMLLFASLPFGSILGIPIRIHWSAPLGPLIWGAMSYIDFDGRFFTPDAQFISLQLGIIVAVPIVVLIHELAHALAARIWGIQTRCICLHMFGGIALVTDPTCLTLKPHHEMTIFVAGPASNLICCVLAILLASVFESGVLTRILKAVAMMNLGMVVFNMLPIWPLDGGQFFRAFLALFQLSSQLLDWITLVISLLVGVPISYLAWESNNFWIFSIVSVLMATAVVLLAIDGHERHKPSAGSPAEIEPKAQVHPQWSNGTARSKSGVKSCSDISAAVTKPQRHP